MQGQEAKDLIAALEAGRIRRRLDHRGFSTLLGIHESYWHRIRTGERSLNLTILKIFMQKLPEVTPEVTIFIMKQGNDGTGGETPVKTGGKTDLGLLGHGKGAINPK